MRSRAGTSATLAVLALATTAGAAPAHHVDTYRVAQQLRVDGGQSATYTLACRGRDVAIDGTWHVDALDPADERFNLVSGVDVLEADTFSRGGYRFELRNNAEGEARLRLTVSCLRRAVGPHAVEVGPRRSVSGFLATGPGTLPNVTCPRGALAIAPGFRLDGLGAVGRVSTRFPAARGTAATLGVTALDPVTATSSARCLRRETTRRGGHRHRLRTAFRGGDTDVGDGRVESFTVSCRGHETAVLGGFRLSGSWYLGQLPAGRERSFRVQSPTTGEAGDARLGVLCLRERSSGPR